MAVAERLSRRAWRRLSREPRHEDGAWLAPFGLLLLLVNVLFSSWQSVASLIIIFAAALTVIAVGVTESLPPRWRTSVVVLRVGSLHLNVLALAAFSSKFFS